MEKEKKKVIEAMKAKIEDVRGNVDEEFVESIEKESKQMDKDLESVEKVSEMLDNAVVSATPEAYHAQVDIVPYTIQTASSFDFYEEKITDLEEQLAERKINRDKKGIIDKFLGKFASRKLFVWTLATFAMFYTKIPADAWVTLSGIYIGTVGVADIVSIAKGKY